MTQVQVAGGQKNKKKLLKLFEDLSALSFFAEREEPLQRAARWPPRHQESPGWGT